jgi:CubicO group peptidase (beta-lactamase class C family)
MEITMRILRIGRWAIAVVIAAGSVITVRAGGRAAGDLTSRVDEILAREPDFSGVVLIADHGAPVYFKAHGSRNRDTRTPLETGDIFELASLSKQFTAMAVMMLQEQGKLSYDDPLEKFLTGLPYAGITVRNLLNHTSGLPDYQEVMDQHWDKSNVAGNAEILEYLKKYHPSARFKPGAKYEYSNTGYILLGSIVEKASGEDFSALLNRRVFVPLGMTTTALRTPDQRAALQTFAIGYERQAPAGPLVRADSLRSSDYTLWLGHRIGPGRISSTAGDLLKWDRALYGDRLVSQRTLAQAFTPAKLNDGTLSNYGFGWEIDGQSVLGTIVRHTGDNPGYHNYIGRAIDVDKTVIILCNTPPKDYDAIIKGVNMLLAGAAPAPSR